MLLIALGFGLFRLVYAGMINLTPQEAYYWVWSLHPDLSYFDHPPMVAYSIRLFTIFWGDTIYGIRLPAILYGAGTTMILSLLAAKFFGPQAAACGIHHLRHPGHHARECQRVPGAVVRGSR